MENLSESELINKIVDEHRNDLLRGYKNWETFNVAVWLGNDYPLYRVASGYSKYPTPYLSLRADLKESFKFTDTRDGVSLWDRKLDIKALDECLKEMNE